MGEDKEKYHSEPTSLETILDYEIYGKKETNLFKRAKQGIERFVIKNKNNIIAPLSIACGGLAAYVTTQVQKSSAHILQQLGTYDLSRFHDPFNAIVFGLGGASIAYLTLDYLIKNNLGKKICDIKNLKDKIQKKKENFIIRNKLPLSIATGIIYGGYLANRLYQSLGVSKEKLFEVITQNFDKFALPAGIWAVGLIGASYFLYDQIGKTASFNKKSWKSSTGSLIWHFSREDGLRYLEKESKKGNVYADNNLSRLKKNFAERFEYRKKVIEALKKDKTYYGQEVHWLKYFSLGSDYFGFKRKKGYMTVLDMAMQMYHANPDRAIRIINKLSNIKEHDIKTSILATRNYFLHAHGDDQKPHWQELRYWLEKEGNLQLVESTEGRVSKFLDEFVNKTFIFKDYREDKTDKFFIENAIHSIFKDSPILVEVPLFFYDEGNLQKHIFIRNGQLNLREKLEQAGVPEKRECFEKVIPLILNYQEKIHAALEKPGNEYVLNSDRRGEKRRIVIPVLDIEENLMQRAFIGYDKMGLRLGVNEHLPLLINKIKEYQEANQYLPVMRFNHGDAFLANITETLCVIDPRPKITHPLYDMTYLLFDPALISLDFDSKKEKILEEILKKDEFRSQETELNHAFNSLYLHNALCRTGSLYFQKKNYELNLVINELLEFSQGKIYEKELITYLKTSPVKGMLKT